MDSFGYHRFLMVTHSFEAWHIFYLFIQCNHLQSPLQNTLPILKGMYGSLPSFCWAQKLLEWISVWYKFYGGPQPLSLWKMLLCHNDPTAPRCCPVTLPQLNDRFPAGFVCKQYDHFWSMKSPRMLGRKYKAPKLNQCEVSRGSHIIKKGCFQVDFRFFKKQLVWMSQLKTMQLQFF